MSFRNRCMVVGGNGPIILSVPLLKGRDQRNITGEVLIDNRQPWQSQHWKTIVSCYNRSPWFVYYEHELMEIFTRPFERLVDWDLVCFNWAVEKLGLSIGVEMTSSYKQDYDKMTVDDARDRYRPATIKKQFPATVSYAQVFEDRFGFLPHMSILDLLFCEGKNARVILEKGAAC